ncbi:cytochrome P450 [Linderina pennispora]|uniref:Cytochrome P450 n=1 Tax=Linderina pennispora TaxID=61395 RepID=A0A1Y1WAV4_9FUNG|nr:cytochrome P450 [Linderina pennispora]ORX70572.1 cytochrome P450 [Linderina pennispora]
MGVLSNHCRGIGPPGLLGYKAIYALYFSPLRHIPGPFLARITSKRNQIISMIGKIGHYAQHEYDTYGDLYVLEPNAVAISNPSDIRTVFGSHAFLKSSFYEALNVFGIPNTVSAMDPTFVGMRKRQLGPYFNPVYLGKMEPAILKHGYLALKNAWEERIAHSPNGKISINYMKDFALATFDTIGALAFGQEFNGLKHNNDDVAKWASATIILHGTRAAVPLTKYFPFSLLLRPLEAKFKRLSEFCDKAIASRKELLRVGAEKPVDLLQAFIDAEDPESKTTMDDLQVKVESIVAMSAGSDTSSVSLTWTIFLLMVHPEIYAKARDQVRSNFPVDHVITYAEARSKLSFVKACLYESLRLCPVGGGYLPRVSPPGGITLQGHFIPPGMEIYVNFPGVSHHASAWTDPLKYDPARFLNNDEAHRNLFTFGPGVRMCPGRHLAKIEMLTILSNMLKDFDMALPEDYTHLGPDILDANVHILVTEPVDPKRDCQ